MYCPCSVLCCVVCLFVVVATALNSLLCHDEGDAVGLVGSLQGWRPLPCAAVEHGQGGEGLGDPLSGARHAAQLIRVVHYGVVMVQLEPGEEERERGRETERERQGEGKSERKRKKDKGEMKEKKKDKRRGLDMQNGGKEGEERKNERWSVVKGAERVTTVLSVNIMSLR